MRWAHDVEMAFREENASNWTIPLDDRLVYSALALHRHSYVDRGPSKAEALAAWKEHLHIAALR